MLLLQHGQDVLLGAFDSSAGSLELNVGATGALLRDVQGDIELGLDTATGVAATADKKTVLSSGDVENLSDLVLALLDEVLDSGDDAVDDLTITLKANGLLGALGLGEADHPGGTAVRGASGLSHDLANIGTCVGLVNGINRVFCIELTASTNQSLVVLLLDIDRLGNSSIKFAGTLLQDLLGFRNLLLGTLDANFNTT